MGKGDCITLARIKWTVTSHQPITPLPNGTAVGILAVMFALGTFGSQKVGAQSATLTVSDVKLELATHKAGTVASEDNPITVKFTLSRDAVVDDQIAIGLLGLGSIPASATATGPGRDGDQDVMLSSTSAAQLGDNTWQVSTYTFVNLADGEEYQGFGAGEVTLKFTADLTTPQSVDTVRAAVAVGDTIAATTEMSDAVGVGVVLNADPQTPGSNSYITVEVASG